MADDVIHLSFCYRLSPHDMFFGSTYWYKQWEINLIILLNSNVSVAFITYNLAKVMFHKFFLMWKVVEMKERRPYSCCLRMDEEASVTYAYAFCFARSIISHSLPTSVLIFHSLCRFSWPWFILKYCRSCFFKESYKINFFTLSYTFNLWVGYFLYYFLLVQKWVFAQSSVFVNM